MPPRIDRADRLLLTAAAVLLATAIVVAALFGRPAEETEFGQVASTYRTGPGGAMATLQLLRECGYDVQRWERSPQDLPAAENAIGYTLVIAEPTSGSTHAERQAIDRFVLDGGRLLVAGDIDSLVSWVPVSPVLVSDTVVWNRVGSARASRRADQLWMRAQAEWPGAAGRAGTLYAHDSTPGVVTRSHGKGEVIWWAGTTPLTNRGVERSANLELLFDTLGRPGGRQVLWDEYFHGIRGNTAEYLFRTPLKWALLQMLVLFAMVCATWARRFTPVRVPASESRTSQLEFVDALGGLYARAGAAAFAIRAVFEDVRLRLGRRLGLPPATPTEALAAAAAARLGDGGPELAALLLRAEHAGREDAATTEREALALAQLLDAWDLRWQSGSRFQLKGSKSRREEP